jgi:hypothetical protein
MQVDLAGIRADLAEVRMDLDRELSVKIRRHAESGSVEVNVRAIMQMQVDLANMRSDLAEVREDLDRELSVEIRRHAGQPPPIEPKPSLARRGDFSSRPRVSDSAQPNNSSIPESTPELSVNIEEEFREDIKWSLRVIGEDARLHCNPVTLHRFAVRQMMMNNPHIKFYYIKWPSVVDYFLDWHWWLTRKFWKLVGKGTFWRFLLLVGVVVVVVVPGLNILFLSFQSLFMLVYLISFALYVVNVCACCNNEDPWETMIRCDRLSEINHINFYIAVDLESQIVITDCTLITYESTGVKAAALRYREKFQETSLSIPLMLYGEDFVYLYKEVMLYGFANVAGLFVLSVLGVVVITSLISK